MVWAVSLLTTELIPRSLTPMDKSLVFGVCLNSVTRWGPLVQTVLYPKILTHEASPKAISERTSYLQVRLEFHPSPQLIPALFNVRGFGPPCSVTWTSTWTWVDHLVSRLPPQTKIALFRLAFAAAPPYQLNLACNRNSPVHSTKGTPSPVKGLRLLVGTWFQELFHSPSGVLFIFPSRYWFTIGH